MAGKVRFVGRFGANGTRNMALYTQLRLNNAVIARAEALLAQVERGPKAAPKASPKARKRPGSGK